MASSLALLSQAATGSTYDELKNGLHLDGDKTIVANEFHVYFDQLHRSVGQATLSMANHIFVQEGHQVNKNFQQVATEKFASGVEQLDFSDSGKSAEIINHFVDEATNNKIKQIIEPDKIDADTRMFLVNVIYFKSNWEVQFRKDRTREKEFYINELNSVPIKFMFNQNEFNHIEKLEDLEASAIEMKYANSNMSFVIVLPSSRTGLRELEMKMKHYGLTNIISQMDLHEVDVSIPKFKVNYDIELNDVLKSVSFIQDSIIFS